MRIWRCESLDGHVYCMGWEGTSTHFTAGSGPVLFRWSGLGIGVATSIFETVSSSCTCWWGRDHIVCVSFSAAIAASTIFVLAPFSTPISAIVSAY